MTDTTQGQFAPYLQTPGFGGWLADMLLTSGTSMAELGEMLGGEVSHEKMRGWLSGEAYPTEREATMVANLAGASLAATGFDPVLSAAKNRDTEPTSALREAEPPGKIVSVVRSPGAKEKPMPDNVRGRDAAMESLRTISKVPGFPGWLAGEMYKRDFTMTDLGKYLGHGGDGWHYKRVSPWLHGKGMPTDAEMARIKDLFARHQPVSARQRTITVAGKETEVAPAVNAVPAPDPHTPVVRTNDVFRVPAAPITGPDEIALRIKCSDIPTVVRLLQQAGITAVI